MRGLSKLLSAAVFCSLLAALTIGGVTSAVRAAATMPSAVPVEVSMFEAPKGDGYIFANDKGLPFFTNDRDANGKIGCDDVCLTHIWQPVWAQGSSRPLPDWTLVARDEYRQWAYKGKVIYSYIGDASTPDDVRALAKKDGHFHEVLP